MNWIDIIVLIPLCWYAFKGLKNGFLQEVISLAALFLGLFISYKFSDLIALWITGTTLAKPISFSLCFILTIVLVNLLGRILKRVLKPVLSEFLDKALGVLFGILMLTTTSTTGAVLQMLSHGLMTALFFALIGMIYGRTHTRDVRLMTGLMQIMPFLGVCFVIAGLANLGLPGLSGFVAEMSIFVGSFQNADTFHRVLTVMATCSIVVAAVYILRMVGKMLYGVCTDEHHLKLTDATWEERFAVICLIVCIAGIGLFPSWISSMISDSVAPIIDAVKQAI